MPRLKRVVVVVVAVAAAVALMASAGWAQQKKALPPISTADFTEIQRLLYTNHTGYDFANRDNGDMWTSTFTEDAVLDNPPTHIQGPEAVRAFAMNQYKRDPKNEMRHWTSTFHVTPHPEGAILSAFYVTITRSGANPGMVFGQSTGRYESLVVKTKAGWRIKHHVVIVEGPVRMFEPPAPAK